MTYRIKYEYQTGNSFGHEDSEGVLEMTWKNKDVAKDNLQRIREHYEFYEKVNRARRWPPNIDINKTIEEARAKDWFVDDRHDLHLSLKLKTDDGKDWQISAPWCGYFERLYGASIVEDDMSISF